MICARFHLSITSTVFCLKRYIRSQRNEAESTSKLVENKAYIPLLTQTKEN